jgi:mono/diheme cytochrome c family protein
MFALNGKLVTVCAVALLAVPFFYGSMTAQIGIEPGSAPRGSALFREKGCFQCHAFNAAGGAGAPDLAQLPERNVKPAELASSMWNHAPVMWDAMPIVGTRVPKLTSPEAADLMAYFYSLLLYPREGSEARGRIVYQEKNCASCHNDEPGIGPALSDWSRAEHPLVWPERMWNHATAMNEEVTRSRLQWPRMTAQEVTDLIAFFQSQRGDSAGQRKPLASDPERGQIAFDRNCRSCHGLGPDGDKIDLLAQPAPETYIGYVARMWNHVPAMAGRAGGKLPQLERGEMIDIGAYLFARSYFDEKGDVSEGQMVFGENCAACHGGRRQEFRAPDLALNPERFSPVTLTAALWSHDRAIQQIGARAGIPAPHFEGREMVHLIAYLNSRLVTRVAPLREPSR